MKYPKVQVHIRRAGGASYVFKPEAASIAILDRRGRIVWEKSKSEPLEALRWEGLDFRGVPVEVGTYTCKITYPDKLIIYVPFVFMM